MVRLMGCIVCIAAIAFLIGYFRGIMGGYMLCTAM